MNINNQFPAYFPDCCPPVDSNDAGGAVFRIVKDENLTDEDFLSHHELGLAHTADQCRRCGVSVFNSFENALHLQKIKPRLGNAISKGELNHSAGKMLLTNKKSGHIDWWAYDSVDRKSFFEEPKLCA